MERYGYDSVGPTARTTWLTFCSYLARARHINNFGLTNPRLDRLQGLHEFRELAYRPSFKLSLCEALTFLSSIPIWERLMDLFNGRVVYQRHWAVFFKDMRRNWFLMGALVRRTLTHSPLQLLTAFFRSLLVPLRMFSWPLSLSPATNSHFKLRYFPSLQPGRRARYDGFSLFRWCSDLCVSLPPPPPPRVQARDRTRNRESTPNLATSPLTPIS